MPAVTEWGEQWRAMDDAQLAVALHDDDPRWVREEFEAIIAAEWPQPVTNPPRLRAAAAEHPTGVRGSRMPGATAFAVLLWRAHGPGADGWARERSPPAPHTTPR